MKDDELLSQTTRHPTDFTHRVDAQIQRLDDL